MTSHTQGKSDTPSVVRRKYRTYISAHNGSTHHITKRERPFGLLVVRTSSTWIGVNQVRPLTGREKEKRPAIVFFFFFEIQFYIPHVYLRHRSGHPKVVLSTCV
jgi:hypothetical protein